MELFKTLAGLLGFARDEEQHHHDDAVASDVVVPPFSSGATFVSAQRFPTRGFSVIVQVPIERDAPPPLLVFCLTSNVGIQFEYDYSVAFGYDKVSEADVIRARNQIIFIHAMLKSSLLLHIDGTTPVAEDIGHQLVTYGRRIPYAELFADSAPFSNHLK